MLQQQSQKIQEHEVFLRCTFDDCPSKRNRIGTIKRKRCTKRITVGKQKRINSTSSRFFFNNFLFSTSALLISPILFLWAGGLFLICATAVAESLLPEKEAIDRCPIRIPSSIDRPPIVIGHRGAAFNLPEHTIPAYRLALELGADYIEPDLVPTRDGHLVSYHGLDLGISTNIESIFPGRKRTMDANGETGYFVQDFTLEEIKLIKVRQRVEHRTKDFDDLFRIPSLSEIIDLLYDWKVNVRPRIGSNLNTSKTSGRPGLYAELKYPDLLQEDANISMADLFLKELKSHPKSNELFFDKTECESLKFDEYLVPPLVVQSFEIKALKTMRELFELQTAPPKNGVEVEAPIWSNGLLPPLIILVSETKCFQNYESQEADENFWFEVVEARVNGIGPDKACLLTDHASLGRDFMETARLEHRLAVHPWTERMELSFVTPNHGFATAEDELMYLICVLKIDGIFAENVDLAVRVGMKGCDDYMYEGVSYGTNKKKNVEQRSHGTTVCYETEKEEVIIVGLAFCAFGLFLGASLTYWVMARCDRKKKRRNFDDGMAAIPSAEDYDDAGQGRRNVTGNELEML
mmetsp:Transcript_7264/g.9662  ORF Transcript_7264/g.9662 Transcript_7264/m.9662 type:complete len:578 (+) Transcript_7264:160-1893(+)